MGRLRKGSSRKQKAQRQAASEAGITARSKAQKENLSPPSPSTRGIDEHKRRTAAAEAESARLRREHENLKKDKKNSARRERRHRKKIADLQNKIKAAQDELKESLAHGEAQVRKTLHKRSEDKLGWQRRIAEAERRVAEAERCRVWTEQELKSKISVLSQLRGVLRLTRRQIRNREQTLKKVRNGSRSAKHVLRMHAKRGRAYKIELRAIARVLVSSGCKEGKVGELMQDIAKVFGVDLDRAMSRRTVRRAVLEGLVASQVQLGVELKRYHEQ
ncbi:hypothetical protein R3P38DRAFT_3201051 [Favolaschia claudopus]|uniref:Uncharacterized protein n=1 Tax=Favolaschia claudopus TaxID=2862362 RepID=A0AAW0AVP3_9AGAR